ncbi:MAG TPA: restriction endonuclease [Thermomicrobiales bacterium]|nr:restriction endonuclease [Thermomicrobiales bacterium]
MPVPKYQEMFNPLLQAIKRLGGSATISELDEEVTKSLALTDEELAEPHDERQTELEYRLAWARTYLKGYGLLDNSARGVWVVTPKGNEVEKVDPQEVLRFFRGHTRGKRKAKVPGATEHSALGERVEVGEAILAQTWRDELLETLFALRPDAFERLCQRLLRESGFVEVKVTGRSGDGGIDGVGIVRLGGLLGFPVLFQCKRYRGSISPNVIRDFRGAMIGRADRGLVLTTGTFSREAKKEATRDGAPPVDLVDGEQLLDKLKELRLGVQVEMIEKVSALPDWFRQI